MSPELKKDRDFLEKLRTQVSEPQVLKEKEDFQKALQEQNSSGVSLLNKEFRVNLMIYMSKNNVMWDLYDVFDSNKYYSMSGGKMTKRGTDKNSSKVIQEGLTELENFLKVSKADHLTIHLVRGKLTKRSLSTERAVVKLLGSWVPQGVTRYHDLLLKSRDPHGKPNKRKGGRRGRRV